MHTVVETPTFARRARALPSGDEHAALIDFLAANPYAGDEIVGTGGVRKVRFAARGKGKSGGARVIYYVVDDDSPVFALLIYGKNERADLTAGQRAAVRTFAEAIKAERRRKR